MGMVHLSEESQESGDEADTVIACLARASSLPVVWSTGQARSWQATIHCSSGQRET